MLDLHLPGADVRLDRDFLPRQDAHRLAARLREGLPWRQGHISIQGRSIPEPRLTSWHGDAGSYTYSGRTLQANPWTEELLEIRAAIEAVTGARFNSVLANLYREGHRDSIGMHADDERGVGDVIASISLGREREFILAPKKGREGRRTKVALPHGSLLVMAGETQRNWLHGVDKEPQPSPAWRINLTYRSMESR